MGEDDSEPRQPKAGNPIVIAVLLVIAFALALDLAGASPFGSKQVEAPPSSYRDKDVENLMAITTVLRDAVLDEQPIAYVKKNFNKAQMQFAFGENVTKQILEK